MSSACDCCTTPSCSATITVRRKTRSTSLSKCGWSAPEEADVEVPEGEDPETWETNPDAIYKERAICQPSGGKRTETRALNETTWVCETTNGDLETELGCCSGISGDSRGIWSEIQPDDSVKYFGQKTVRQDAANGFREYVYTAKPDADPNGGDPPTSFCYNKVSGSSEYARSGTRSCWGGSGSYNWTDDCAANLAEDYVVNLATGFPFNSYWSGNITRTPKLPSPWNGSCATIESGSTVTPVTFRCNYAASYSSTTTLANEVELFVGSYTNEFTTQELRTKWGEKLSDQDWPSTWTATYTTPSVYWGMPVDSLDEDASNLGWHIGTTYGGVLYEVSASSYSLTSNEQTASGTEAQFEVELTNIASGTCKIWLEVDEVFLADDADEEDEGEVVGTQTLDWSDTDTSGRCSPGDGPWDASPKTFTVAPPNEPGTIVLKNWRWRCLPKDGNWSPRPEGYPAEEI